MRRYQEQGVVKLDIKELLRANRKQLIILGAVAIAVVVAILVAVQVAGQRAAASSFLVTEDTVKIGIRTDVPGFGQVDESGAIEGFDKDVIDEVMNRMMGGQEKLYHYVPITSQDAGANIKYGVTNINVGLLVDGTDRVKGFRMTEPYYTDRVVAVVRGTSRLDKLSNMEGGKLGVLNAAIPSADVENYLKKNNLKFDLLRYSDYESAMSDIENNRVNAVVMPFAIARQFETAGFRILAEPLYEVGYSVMLPTGQTAFTRQMDKVIEEMKKDGTIDRLRVKWNV